ncbi:GAF and ANTAR domain-containing protein [Pseudarthrobacter oxydans]|uniref:GAF and ANTAR domain-containing protein n=1 Tax=Pseudarthrobacter oxydans TaxID=1671 RepID=UPI003D2DCDB5
MPNTSETEPMEQLQKILVGAENAVEFLFGLARVAADAVSNAAGTDIECAVTVKVRRRPATVAGSSQRALELDQIEQAVGDGPCISALQAMSPVLIKDVTSDQRWPELMRKYAEANVRSTLGAPLEISNTATAALNFFAPNPEAFSPDVHDKALGFAAAAGTTLNLSVRISTAQNRADDLEAAMQTRTAINLACGVIMAQNRCSQAEAMEILTRVSSNRNRKLRDVATELIEQLSGATIHTHFDA